MVVVTDRWDRIFDTDGRLQPAYCNRYPAGATALGANARREPTGCAVCGIDANRYGFSRILAWDAVRFVFCSFFCDSLGGVDGSQTPRSPQSHIEIGYCAKAQRDRGHEKSCDRRCGWRPCCGSWRRARDYAATAWLPLAGGMVASLRTRCSFSRRPRGTDALCRYRL
jgi:hypothetical protein